MLASVAVFATVATVGCAYRTPERPVDSPVPIPSAEPTEPIVPADSVLPESDTRRQSP